MEGVSTERKTVQGAQRPGADAEKDEDGRGGVEGRGGANPDGSAGFMDWEQEKEQLTSS